MKSYFLVFGIFLLIDRPIDGLNFDPAIPCNQDSDCSLFSKDQKNSTCQRGFCACEYEQGEMKNCSGLQIASQQEKTAVPLVYHTCKHNQDCQLSNTFCNTSRSQCECSKGFVSSTDMQKCLQAADSLTFPCTDNKQCQAYQPNTKCQEMQCVCIDDHYALHNTCWKIAVFGGPCSRSEECSHIKGAFCTGKKICGCNENNAIDRTGKYCVPFANRINEPCKENITCSMIPDSICIENKCQCPNGKHFAGEVGQCILNRDIGAPCEKDYECYYADNADTNLKTKGLLCVNTICDCAIDYFKVGDKCVSAGVLTSTDSFLITITIALSSFVYGFYLQ